MLFLLVKERHFVIYFLYQAIGLGSFSEHSPFSFLANFISFSLPRTEKEECFIAQSTVTGTMEFHPSSSTTAGTAHQAGLTRTVTNTSNMFYNCQAPGHLLSLYFKTKLLYKEASGAGSFLPSCQNNKN